MYAVAPDQNKALATPGGQGVCPTCGEPLKAKCGAIVSWRWSHLAREDCDPWAEPDTAWHRAWQQLVAPHQREVVIGCHRADIVAADGVVVELQHSSLPVDQIRERERFYRRMVWIFDAREAHDEERLDLRPKRDHVTFRWKHPRKSIAACRRPVLLDFGKQLLRLRRIHMEAPCGGWGTTVSVDAVVDWMRGREVAA
jgi:competence protein CoiA